MALVPADRRRELPDEPGVYLFRDRRGKVIYVGKAKSIRKRVASHFSGGGRGSNIRGGGDLVDMIDEVGLGEVFAREIDADSHGRGRPELAVPKAHLAARLAEEMERGA